jgi:acyl-CoA reductase-like NAD-dependent aldehyde dehydrogenase
VAEMSRSTVRPHVIAVHSPYSGAIVGEVPACRVDDVDEVVARAIEGARWMAARPAHERSTLLERAAQALERDVDAFATILTAEVGKPLHEARREAERATLVIRWCAAETLRQTGEVITMDALPMGEGRIGFTVPEPCGVVVAIAPFNYPAHLAAHKLGPALASGNSVILKPATTTPLSALFMRDRFLEAGFPEACFQCVAGSGATIGGALCADPRVRKISFTGSVEVGKTIARLAGLKRLTCELGSNCALIVLDDADVEAAAVTAVQSGFVNAGQVCTSTQRVLVASSTRDQFVERVVAEIDKLRPGDPLLAETTLGPVISEAEAKRVVSWLAEAASLGAEVVRGGDRDGQIVYPAMVLDAPTTAKVWREELFGPAIVLREFRSDDEALDAANDTTFGLSAGVYTTNIHRALRFAQGLRSGSVHVNHGPLWRTAFMPYGGYGDSGFGKEGVKYAMQEMSEQKLIVMHPPDGA